MGLEEVHWGTPLTAHPTWSTLEYLQDWIAQRSEAFSCYVVSVPELLMDVVWQQVRNYPPWGAPRQRA